MFAGKLDAMDLYVMPSTKRLAGLQAVASAATAALGAGFGSGELMVDAFTNEMSLGNEA